MLDKTVQFVYFIGLDNWITILCSFIGLLGVYLTIQFTRNQFREDKRIGIKPHLDLKLKDKICLGLDLTVDKNVNEKFCNNEETYFVDKKNMDGDIVVSFFYIELDLENIGLGHALNYKIVDIYGENLESEIKENLKTIKKESKSKIWLIVYKYITQEDINLLDKVKNDYSQVDKILLSKLTFKAHENPTIQDKLKTNSEENIYIDIEYNDLLGNKYKKIFCLELYFDLFIDFKKNECLLDGKVRVSDEKNREYLIK